MNNIYRKIFLLLLCVLLVSPIVSAADEEENTVLEAVNMDETFGNLLVILSVAAIVFAYIIHYDRYDAHYSILLDSCYW